MLARSPLVLLAASVASAVPFALGDGIDAGLEKRQAPAPLASYNGWNHYNCFTDSVNSRQLTHPEATVGGTQGMTIERCLDACHNDGYGVAGLEFGQECYCGYGVQNYGALTDCSAATMPCTGNALESCGGPGLLDVYVFANQSPTLPGTLVGYHDYSAVGCYDDSPSARDFSEQMFLSSPMTGELCIDACLGAGYEFAGIEDGTECFCGRTAPTAASSTDFVNFGCNVACAGDPNTFCGGAGKIEVFQSNSPTTMPQNVASYNGWSYTGCYEDSVSNRVLPARTDTSQDSVMTVEICLDACSAAGYPFAGLEYSQECYCGAALPPTVATDGRCSMVCNGNSLEYCGGAAGLSVYSHPTVTTTTTTTSTTATFTFR